MNRILIAVIAVGGVVIAAVGVIAAAIQLL